MLTDTQLREVFHFYFLARILNAMQVRAEELGVM
jgi:hypothetical protein